MALPPAPIAPVDPGEFDASWYKQEADKITYNGSTFNSYEMPMNSHEQVIAKSWGSTRPTKGGTLFNPDTGKLVNYKLSDMQAYWDSGSVKLTNNNNYKSWANDFNAKYGEWSSKANEYKTQKQLYNTQLGEWSDQVRTIETKAQVANQQTLATKKADRLATTLRIRQQVGARKVTQTGKASLLIGGFSRDIAAAGSGLTMPRS
jgi:hypothetical protein